MAKKTQGRPTLYSADYCARVEEFLAKGKTLKAFAGEIGVDEETIQNWKKAHPNFFGSIKKGEAASLKYWENILEQAAYGQFQHKNLAAIIFLLKNRFRREYGDQLQMSGDFNFTDEPSLTDDDNP